MHCMQLVLHSHDSCQCQTLPVQSLQRAQEQQSDPALAALVKADTEQAAANGGWRNIVVVEVRSGCVCAAACSIHGFCVWLLVPLPGGKMPAGCPSNET